MRLNLVSLLALLGCTGGEHMLKPGAPAPDLVGKGAGGETVRLSEQRGQTAVVYFYPKDATPGCTREACAFRDAFDRYAAAGITIFGVSRDDERSHEKFRDKHKLPFPLVADVDGAVQKAYGVPGRLGMPARVTFLVDPDGKVAHVWNDVDPGVHADQVLARARQLTTNP